MVISVSACKTTGDGDTTTTTTTKAATTTTKAATTTTTTAEVDPLAEHLDISFIFLSTNDATLMSENQFCQLYLEDKFNVSMTFSPSPTYNSPTEFNLIVSAGALPDGGWTSLTIKAPELYQKGVTRLIYKEDVEKFMPNYATKWLPVRPLMEAWQSLAVGEYYGLYQISPVKKGGGFMTAVRLDWMENLGIAPKGNVRRLVPEGAELKDHAADADIECSSRLYVTDYQYKWDEFVDILRAFVNQDPDQNGEADTYGYSGNLLEFMDGYWSFHLFPVEGMNFRWVKEPDGSAAPQIYSKVYKQFLEMHKALDDEGLLIPDYWTAGVGDVWEWWASGKAGALGQVIGYIAAPSLPPFSIIYNNPDAKVLCLPPTEGRTSMASDFMGGSDIGFYFVNKNASDAKYERILRMFDWMFYSDEGKELLQYGVEGIHFNERDEKGLPVRLSADELNALPVEQKHAGEIFYVTLNNLDSTWDMKTRNGLMLQYEKDNWPASEGYYVFFGPGSGAVLAATAFENPDNAELKTSTYREYVTNICTGVMDSDTAYERMMGVMNSLGYQEYLELVQDNMYVVAELEAGNLVTAREAQ